jgi:serine protease AprX
MLNAQAAVLEAAFPQRHFGQWRGTAYRNQIQFVNSAPAVFSGTSTAGSSSDSSILVPANTLLASVQIAWGGTQTLNNLNLSLVDPHGTSQTPANAGNQPGLTGHRQRAIVNVPAAGTWKARVVGSASATSQAFTGVFETITASYAPLDDVGSLDASVLSEIYQNFRSLQMWPIGQHFRPSFAITRADFAAALVMGARVPQYLPAQSNYPDVRDRATMLFVESAQAAPAGPLFLNTASGSNFQPDVFVDRLTAVVALVRAAGLRQQAESGVYTLPFTDAASIPASLRGYVAVAVQNGFIKTDGATFNPQSSFTRLDLSHALVRMATLATQ